MLFDNWEGVLRTAVVGVAAYAILITTLRASGKRTLSKMNAFDLVVTVALGSTLATNLLSSNVALTDGATAFGVLVGLQYADAWLSVRSTRVSRLVKADPVLLLHRGRFIEHALKRERVTEGGVLAAMGAQGFPAADNIEGVILETDGSFSVVGEPAPPGARNPVLLERDHMG